MKSTLFSFFCLLAWPVMAQESQPTPTPSPNAALAEELMVLFQIDKNLETSLQQTAKMQEQMLASQKLTPEQKAKQEQVMKVARDETRALMSWEKIKPLFVSIYAETFTAEELQGMIAFFKSPTGQKWIEKQPELQMATMQKLQTLLMEAQPKIQEAIKRAAEAEQKPAEQKEK